MVISFLVYILVHCQQHKAPVKEERAITATYRRSKDSCKTENIPIASHFYLSWNGLALRSTPAKK